MITLHVSGKPEPKGSTRIVPVRGSSTRAVRTTSDNPKVEQWQRTIRWSARTLAAPLFDGPVYVGLVFTLTPPKRRTRGDVLPMRKPDVDKLARAVLDALTGVLLVDDAQVVELHVHKVYARGGAQPGVGITVAAAWERQP